MPTMTSNAGHFSMGGGASPFIVNNSTDYDASSTDQLSLSPSVTGDRQIWTLGGHLRRDTTGTDQKILMWYENSSNLVQVRLNTSNSFTIRIRVSGTINDLS